MMESAASMAPFSPPETGASSILTPRGSSAFATFCETIGEIVDMSTKMRRRLSASMIPFFPRATSSTSGELGSIVIRLSTCSATAFGDVAALAPALTSSSTGPWLRLWTTRG